MEFWDMAVRMATSLALVLAVMLALTALAKRWFGSRLSLQPGAALVQVLASGYIGPRKAVSLVSVGGELLILGTTQTDIVPLGRLSDAEQIKRVLAQAAHSGLGATPLWGPWSRSGVGAAPDAPGPSVLSPNTKPDKDRDVPL